MLKFVRLGPESRNTLQNMETQIDDRIEKFTPVPIQKIESNTSTRSVDFGIEEIIPITPEIAMTEGKYFSLFSWMVVSSMVKRYIDYDWYDTKMKGGMFFEHPHPPFFKVFLTPPISLYMFDIDAPGLNRTKRSVVCNVRALTPVYMA